ncbi:NAD(+) synthase [Myceligenerans pegani]|uniref:Glutamine-dependent NAD(+) synthetase n=1 Tax=Myceligenerans pegani TaxID=2776917 RepID=A0ABR9N4E3_9MICO|nr:NAD(+) synthase [Myceligenerans sp. TRM 65318]MBE1877974.1 NAD(+) synthase [Myceligenerans sp. TRM 65318]MBE3020245.1 NAD(+) synthase [Myceligenerans sp. TRM 65318]
MDFYNAYAQGFARVAACTVPVTPADPAANAAAVLEQARACHDEGVAVAVFPELCLSGYAIDDLLLQDSLLDGVLDALRHLLTEGAGLAPVLVVGAPLRHGNRLLNCAVVLHRGRILGVAPKSFLPNYREFYEKRHFASGAGIEHATTRLLGEEVPLGTDLIFRADDVPGLAVHVEVCEDLWVPVPPSARAALAGATVLLNLSASPITVARAEDRRLLVRSASSRCSAAYAYTAAGQGESTTDLSWDGQTMVYECGDLLGETERFPDGARRTVVDVDLDRIRQERQRQGSFDDNARSLGITYDGGRGAAGAGGAAGWATTARSAASSDIFREITFTAAPPSGDIGLRRAVDRFPFVPDDADRLAQDCYEAYNIQVSGLERRLTAIGSPKVIIGVSGGLDSTHALVVAAKAMDRLGRPRGDIHAFTLPGFATSPETKERATRLSRALGVTFEEIDIKPAAEQLLKDLDHPYSAGARQYDVTFENVQAGLRTDYLFRLANHRGGIVLGTGDLSELALGWATYGVGDQMSHYAVNTGVPKTLIQHLIRWAIDTEQLGEAGSGTNAVLAEILDQEITPELIPAHEGEAPQSTEASVGPYALQDFSLFWTLRYGMRPSRIAFLAWHAWRDPDGGAWPPGYRDADRTAYDLATIRRWLEVFLRRFFANQFKRSAIPNGPKVLAGGTLSPRGDWRMPSDARATTWLAELEQNVPAG